MLAPRLYRLVLAVSLVIVIVGACCLPGCKRGKHKSGDEIEEYQEIEERHPEDEDAHAGFAPSGHAGDTEPG